MIKLKNETRKKLYSGLLFIVAFILWTFLICLVDVRVIGPQNSSVGFAGINIFVHNLTGVHMLLYHITDWAGLVPVAFMFGFAVLGLIQWIKRKNMFKVDFSILILGIFYIIVTAAYLFFEMFVINYRPVLINGYLEASYPSSTTLLVLCVIPTTMMQLGSRIKHNGLRHFMNILLSGFIAFMVAGRLISGVHWVSDIIGGILLSVGLVKLYDAFSNIL